MYVSHDRKILFVHIPKTGGSAIRELCADLGMERIGSRHNGLSDLTKSKQWRKYRIFTIVRHPVDRLISMYRFHHMYRQLDPLKHQRRWGNLDTSQTALRSFSDFVRDRAKHSIPIVQSDFIRRHDLKVSVYRYEDEAHERIRATLGLEVPVRKDFGVNYLGKYNPDEWSDPEGIAFVREHCAEDFRRFGYG